MTELKTDDPEILNNPSKSHRKRESAAIQALAVELVMLSPDQLETLPLADDLIKEILFARTIKQHGARKRQLKTVGKSLRRSDVEPIREALSHAKNRDVYAIKQHHQIEKWRDRLIDEGDPAINCFINEYPAADRQQLRQIIRKARQEQSAEKT